MMKEVVRYQKATSFYDTYERKAPESITTHYCPGCGHGTIHKIIAETIDLLGIQDRTIMLSPVGCAVFAYYYFDTGNIQCSHGRAPAVATGVKRTVKDAIVISYQGDGDLAGIGMTEIMHAANRGESMTVIFVNNAIYGMTGGQMAPTTPLGQKTLTTPFGRDPLRDGNPIGMTEVMNSLSAPVFIERCAVSTPKEINRTRKAVQKAIKNQMDHQGFSFVEILSPCPTNWRMSPVDARKWIDTEMVHLYPLGNVRDTVAEAPSQSDTQEHPVLDDEQLLALLHDHADITTHTSQQLKEKKQVIIAGFGGQGVLSAGELLATCAMAEQLNVSWLPSYGPEMRGGSAHVSVTLSDSEIGSPVIDHPNVLLAMNGPSLDLFEPLMQPGSLVIVNSSIVKRKVEREDLVVHYIPATDMAREMQLQSAANVVMVTALILSAQITTIDTLKTCIPAVLNKPQFLKQNLQLVDQTMAVLVP
jgi:2-oxoisovalerate ferredoxin oxidoreductase beta subunit